MRTTVPEGANRRSYALQPGGLYVRLGILLAAVYLTFLSYMYSVLDFNFMQSDPAGYWEYSLQFPNPFSEWWLPLYPFLIAIFRLSTFGVLGPVAIMQTITGLAYVTAGLTITKLSELAGLERPYYAGLMLAFFPVSGLVYSVHPIADVVGIALLLLTLLFLHLRKWVPFVFVCAATLLTHKALWFIMLPLLSIVWVAERRSRVPIVLSVIPLCGLVAGGWAQFGTPLWITSWSTRKLLVSRGTLPIFDGIIGPLTSGEVTQTVKGALVLLLVLACGYLSWAMIRSKAWIPASVALGILLMGVFVNQYEITKILSIGRVGVLPLSLALFSREDIVESHLGIVSGKRASILFACFLFFALLSNLAFGYYVAKEYFHQ